MHVQVLRCLNIRNAPILDQAHRLKLELPRKLTPLHDPPPAPSKHLTRCLRNRVQANLDTCNGVSAALRHDLSSFGRGLMERKAMRAVSVDEIIGTSENFLPVARAYSPPDQPPTAPDAF